MDTTELYPLKFDPIYQYRIWGGRRLTGLLSKPLPDKDPVGEAWILSDRDDHPSMVTEGPLKDKTIKELFEQSPGQLMGYYANKYQRFPLLLKFLDCQQVLSVQVHPSDDKKQYIPPGENGKTESWVVLKTGNDAIIYAGLVPRTDEAKIRSSLQDHKVAEDLAHFKPVIGDAVLIKAGTVHTLGDVVVFEAQENSDVTYRLYDWDRVDEKTGKPRDLQVEEAIACIDFNKVNVQPTEPEVQVTERILCEKIIESDHFIMWRYTGQNSFVVGKAMQPRVLVCVEGHGELNYNNNKYLLTKGEVMLIPAIAGACNFEPSENVIVLEIGLPE